MHWIGYVSNRITSHSALFMLYSIIINILRGMQTAPVEISEDDEIPAWVEGGVLCSACCRFDPTKKINK